ncbi:MAG: universal stress protein [Deltaproteobacteria bacterium]|nr:universal stress protein [Deltaproteobacteria bacterium]MBW1870480.1 universal stress protein [Deltaproteobacteria bacterium]
MGLFKRILVAIDFSDFSQEAIRISSGLANAFGGEVLVLHVCKTHRAVDPTLLAARSKAVNSMLELQKEMAKEASKRLEEWIGYLQWGTAEVKTEVASGAPYKVITNRAKEIGADLIVMGSYGRSGFARMLIGSTTEKVVRKATCPVLSVNLPALAK